MIGVCLRVWPRCFTELRSMVGVVTAKVLAQTLRDMKRNGFITRCGLRVNSPHVEYELTPLEGGVMDIIDAAETPTADPNRPSATLYPYIVIGWE